MIVGSVATNPRFGWDVVGRYMTAPTILMGLWTTIWLTFITMVAGYLLGIILAAMRMSSNPMLVALSWLYVWFFRSVPLLVLLLFWFNIAAVYPSIGIPLAPEVTALIHWLGGPLVEPSSYSMPSQRLISAMTAALLGLVMHEAAYAAEVIRGGLLSVEQGQTEAATALGLSRRRIFFRVILPQGMRAIIPPTGNNLIAMLKGTSIVSVLAVEELLYSSQIIYNRTYEVVPLLLVATGWYVIMTSLLTIAQYYVERYYAKGTRNLPDTPLQKLVEFVQIVIGRKAKGGQK